MKKQLIVIWIIASMLFETSLFSQSPWTIEEHVFNKEAVKSADKIVWYGFDVSNTKMRDYDKFDEGQIIVEKHIPAIIGEFGLRFDIKKFQSLLNGKNVIVDNQSIQDLYKKLDYRNFIVLHNRNLTIDTIKIIIKNYTLPQNDGIGVIFIGEMFNDVKDPIRYFSAYMTFFDIQSREVYLSTKVKGRPGSNFGFTKYWVNGMTEALDIYFSHFRKTYKK